MCGPRTACGSWQSSACVNILAAMQRLATDDYLRLPVPQGGEPPDAVNAGYFCLCAREGGRWGDATDRSGEWVVILRCTRKLLDVIKPGPLAGEPASDEDWYGNLLWIDGRKCLLLTHAGTLFTIFEPDVQAAGLRDTGRLVTGLIGRELAREGLGPGTFRDLDAASVALDKTASRTVLGCMNDMAFACTHAVDLAGGLANADIGKINQRLRRNILSARGYRKPIELTMRRAETA
jgi:hypothetical protein